MRMLLFCLMLLASMVATAGAYRWVDENGKVHYGDQPPAGAKRLKPPPKPAGPPRPRSDAETPAASPDSGPEQGVYKEMRYIEICKELNGRVQRYRSSPVLQVNGEDGQPRTLSAEERSALIARTQAQADQACKDAAERGQTDDD